MLLRIQAGYSRREYLGISGRAVSFFVSFLSSRTSSGRLTPAAGKEQAASSASPAAVCILQRQHQNAGKMEQQEVSGLLLVLSYPLDVECLLLATGSL